MKNTKRLLKFTIACLIMTVIISKLFLLDKKSQIIKSSFFVAILATSIICLLTIISFFIERKELIEYKENGYIFKPLDLDMYLDVRILLDDKEKENSHEEQIRLEKYESLTKTYVKQKDIYLVYFENKPYALLRFHKNIKDRTCKIDYISKSSSDLKNEIEVILKKEKLKRTN